MEEVWKLVYIWILGFVIKFYDDLEDLFESKNERLVETVKTLMMVMTCYYLLILAETQYELYWVLYVVSLCLVDWHAYVGSSYFLSANIVVVIICIYVFITKGFTFNFGYFLLAFLLFSLCIPCVETLCCGINGPLHEICKFFGMAPDEPIFQFKTLSKTDLEVSFYKMKIRIASLIHLTLAWLIISFLRSKYNFSNNINQILTAGMCICAVFHGYFLCSSMAQIYAVYFDNNRIINYHNAKNGQGAFAQPCLRTGTEGPLIQLTRQVTSLPNDSLNV
jgi:hypothetical protein